MLYRNLVKEERAAELFCFALPWRKRKLDLRPPFMGHLFGIPGLCHPHHLALPHLPAKQETVSGFVLYPGVVVVEGRLRLLRRDPQAEEPRTRFLLHPLRRRGSPRGREWWEGDYQE